MLDPQICQDLDSDSCDDCSQNPVSSSSPTPWATYSPSTDNDGTNIDGDGICDTTDTDDDNDGVLDASDTDPVDPQICQDIDGDGCDDCSQNPVSSSSPTPWAVYAPSTTNDGTDTDGDGICDAFDTDDDNDGVLDASDTDPVDPQICQDLDSDTCDDCSQNPVSSSSPTPWAVYVPSTSNDGTDTDGDGVCDISDACPGFDDSEDFDGDLIPDGCDPDIDGDGFDNILDCNPLDPDEWTVPQAVLDLKLSGKNTTTFTWSVPSNPGCTAPVFDLLRSQNRADFSGAICIESDDADTVASYTDTPPPGGYFYIVRIENSCGENMYQNSNEIDRTGAACP